MKKLFIADIFAKKVEDNKIVLLGWVGSIRKFKNNIFFDLYDSTGKIQVISIIQNISNTIKREQSVCVSGILHCNENNGCFEIHAEKVDIIGDIDKILSPSPRSNFDIFNESFVDLVQTNRHLYIRNPKVMAALKARDLVLTAIRQWFSQNNYIEITAPVLTPVLLYTENTGINVHVNNQDIFLTQCVAFYLESAVHAFERVYNIGPSFRGAESTSKRHLAEYWHVKAELAFCSFDEFFGVVESLVSSVAASIKPFSDTIVRELKLENFCDDVIKTPFPRVSYVNAIELLRGNGIDIAFGQSLNDKGMAFLTNHFNSPVWVTYQPRSIEGFPYKICVDDDRLTYTADLIATRGCGEILGIADKITNIKELELRLAEKGKQNDPGYNWFKELRSMGMVPHCGVGMGVERLIRWLFQLPHVREAIPFPRSMGRKIYP